MKFYLILSQEASNETIHYSHHCHRGAFNILQSKPMESVITML